MTDYTGEGKGLNAVPEEFRSTINELREKHPCYQLNMREWPYSCKDDLEELPIGTLALFCFGNSENCAKIKSKLGFLSNK
ncbi:MAG: hypothetical protein KAU24_03995 [Candidatus Aenigmarchaeota archaeon]|nr:hypothetical protein [Candidatus Aenigmarchaeota archaeon]